MKKRYTEEHIVKILKEVEGTGKPAEACRKYGVSGATIYNWRKRYGGLELSDLRKLKTLEEENGSYVTFRGSSKRAHLDVLTATRKGLHFPNLRESLGTRVFAPQPS